MGEWWCAETGRGLLLLLLQCGQYECADTARVSKSLYHRLSIVGAIWVLAIRVGAISTASTGTAVSAGLLVSTVRVPAVAAVLIVAGHLDRVVVLCSASVLRFGDSMPDRRSS